MTSHNSGIVKSCLFPDILQIGRKVKFYFAEKLHRLKSSECIVMFLDALGFANPEGICVLNHTVTYNNL